MRGQVDFFEWEERAGQGGHAAAVVDWAGRSAAVAGGRWLLLSGEGRGVCVGGGIVVAIASGGRAAEFFKEIGEP